MTGPPRLPGQGQRQGLGLEPSRIAPSGTSGGRTRGADLLHVAAESLARGAAVRCLRTAEAGADALVPVDDAMPTGDVVLLDWAVYAVADHIYLVVAVDVDVHIAMVPTFVALTSQGPWLLGALVNNIWPVGGDGPRTNCNVMTLQWFVNYNFPGGLYLTSSPIITANWEAHGGNRWTVPLGGGIGRVFKIGEQPVNAQLGAYYNVARPDFGPEWSIRFQPQFLFPE